MTGQQNDALGGPEFTPDKIVASIEQALQECRVDLVPGLINLLTAQDPERAEDVADAIRLGEQIAHERRVTRRAAS